MSEKIRDIADLKWFGGVPNQCFDATTEDFDNLRISKVRAMKALESGRPAVEVHMAVRYKPDEARFYATDRWGYYETPDLPVCRLSVGNAELRDRIHERIREAFDNREAQRVATKTISPLDRLLNIEVGR